MCKCEVVTALGNVCKAYDEEEEVMDEWKDMWRKYGYQGTYKPVHFVGPISDIVKNLSEGLQITRVRCAWITGKEGREGGRGLCSHKDGDAN